MALLRIAAVASLAAPLLALQGTPPIASPVDAYALASMDQAMTNLQQTAARRVARARPRASIDDAYRSRTENYEVHSTKSPRIAFGYADMLEAQLVRMQSLFGSDYAPRRPIVAQIFPTGEGYRGFGENFDERSSVTGGFYAQGDGRDQIAAMDSATGDYLLRIYLSYGAAHQFMANAYPGARIPTALEEGLAMYVAMKADRETESFFWANFNTMRSDTASAWTSIEQLAGANIQALDTLTKERGIAPLIQLGCATHYLRHALGETEAESIAAFDAYVALVLTNGNYRDHPIHKLLTTSAGKLDADLKAWN